ncbi:unnamed protein product [Darwinula stevensoni]|uniref:LIM zinc-binding domain-containing protein n=1 Tax=Darwinula stevensoni TaxID=69355 RepID=A0A7R9FTR4_9CRUS|nr:unnamed protein product [Darwinula stevensoni]CAG0905921.1 unnamed protein product [Darwinula stevensoni]
MPGVLEGPGLINDHKPDVRTLQGPSPTSSSQGLSPTNHELPGSPGSCIRSNEPAYLELRPVKPKSEPGELDLSSPDSGAVVYCAGCHNKILDRWYLQAVDRAWHASCLRCAQCARPLEGALTCFARQGSIYCKEDYLR